MMNNIKQDPRDKEHPNETAMDVCSVANISTSGTNGAPPPLTEPKPPTLQVEHPSYSDNYVMDGQQMISEQRMREILVELQQTWLKEYKQNREKLLIELTEKLHQEYLSDLQRKQTEFMAQYRDEMETERLRQEELFQRRLEDEVQSISEKHRREVQMMKKKQWCWQCEQEAIYHCCWNTAYCSTECQQAHWPMHRRYCRRKKAAAANQQGGGGGGGGGNNASMKNSGGGAQNMQQNGQSRQAGGKGEGGGVLAMRDE